MNCGVSVFILREIININSKYKPQRINLDFIVESSNACCLFLDNHSTSNNKPIENASGM